MKAKKIFSLFICAVIIFTALPVCARAQERTEEYIDSQVVFKYSEIAADKNALCSESNITKDIASCGITSLTEIKTENIFDTGTKIKGDGYEKTALFVAETKESVEKTCRSLSALSCVEYAEPNYVFEEDSINLPTEVTSPNRLFTQYTDWWMNTVMQIPAAWQEFDTLGEGVTVAVIDSGLFTENPEIAENVWEDKNGYRGYNAVTDTHDVTPTTSHGGNVAGIIAGVAGQNPACIGVAPKSKIMPIKVSKYMSAISMTSVVQGINYAVGNGADIISMSLSSAGNDKTLEDACRAAYDSGIILVSSAGNNAQDAVSSKRYPAVYESVISVMALSSDKKQLASFSNYDSTHEYYNIAAPGETIIGLPYSESAINAVSGMSGTSQATPIIAGLAALYLSVYPTHTPSEFRRALLESSTDTCTSNSSVVTNAQYTFPVANAMKLLKYPHTEPTVKAVSGTTAAVDEERSFIYGLAENYSSIGDYVSVTDGTYEFIPTENGNGTGSIFRVYTLSGEVFRDYEIVIFGDTDGDAKCDGMDATICEYIISGGTVPDCVKFAADVNFDDSVMISDLKIILGCGIFTDFVEQIR